ncbi:hypothetical protein ACFL20_06555 [Spirochaetota bacterium]
MSSNLNQQYGQTVVKGFVKEAKREERNRRAAWEAGYYIPYIAAGYVFGACLGAGLAFYVIYKVLMVIWEGIKMGM